MHPIEATALIAEEPDELVCATCDMAFQSAWLLCQHCQLGHHMKIFKTSMLLLKKAHEKDNNDKSSPESSTCIADPSESVPDSFENIYHSSIQLLNRLSDVPQTTSNKEDVAVVTKTEVVHAPVDIDDDESGGDDNGNSDNAENNNSAMEIGLKQEPEEPSELDSSTSKEMVEETMPLKSPVINKNTLATAMNGNKHIYGQLYSCHHCGKRYQSPGSLNLHIRTSHALHKCAQCNKTFSKIARYTMHLKRHTEETQLQELAKNVKERREGQDVILSCHICGREYFNHEDMKTHLRKHVGERPFKCQFCQKYFKTKSNLIDHVRIHSAEKRFTCEHCSKEFVHRNSYKRHLKSHTEEEQLKEMEMQKAVDMQVEKLHNKEISKLSCISCGKEFAQAINLKTHMKMKHMDDRPYECSYCSLGFKSKGALKDHVRTHTGQYRYKCRYCGKKSIRRAACTCDKYIEENGQAGDNSKTPKSKRSYQCSECNQIFPYKQAYQRHLKSHNSNRHGPVFRCTHCHFSCKSKKEIDEHKKTHGLTAKPPSLSCDICGKTFLYKGSVARHMYLHTNVKPFHCDACPKSFIQHSNLVSHMRTHSGEKPYQCDFCGVRYKDSCTLNKHRIATHIEPDKTYQCETCGKEFTRIYNLSRHKRKIHKIFTSKITSVTL